MSFFCIVSGESVIRMRDAGEGSDLDIFFRGLVRDMILLAGAVRPLVSIGLRGVGRELTEEGLRIYECWTVGVVEVRDAFTCEFEMLRLVFADWDVCCSVLVSFSSPPFRCSCDFLEGNMYL